MFDEGVVKEIGYKISLSAIFITTLFLSFVVFYFIGFGILISVVLSLTLALVTYLTSKKSLERLRKSL